MTAAHCASEDEPPIIIRMGKVGMFKSGFFQRNDEIDFFRSSCLIRMPSIIILRYRAENKPNTLISLEIHVRTIFFKKNFN